MTYFHWINGNWVAGRPIQGFSQSRFQAYVADVQSPLVNGKNLKAVDWSDIGVGDVYVLPIENNLQAPKPQTWNEKLLSAPVSAQSTFIHIWVFCPKIETLRDQSVDDRLRIFAAALESATKIGADVFVGPECFFSHHSDKLAMEKTGNQSHLYSKGEKDRVVEVLKLSSINAPKMLIIPGTCLWIDDNKLVRNTGLIYCRQSNLYLEHHKSVSHLESRYARSGGGVFDGGGLPFTDFTYREFSCRYQICAEMGTDLKAMKDLHILSGLGIGGGLEPRAHGGGWVVLSDGTGSGRIEKCPPPNTVTPMHSPLKSDSFSTVVHIHKLRT